MISSNLDINFQYLTDKKFSVIPFLKYIFYLPLTITAILFPVLVLVKASSDVLLANSVDCPKRKSPGPESIMSDVQLTIDVSRDKRRISKYIYGVNIANWCPTYYLDLCEPKLKKAGVAVVRLGATNMERYNYKTNRMFNAMSRENEYVPIRTTFFLIEKKSRIWAARHH